MVKAKYSHTLALSMLMTLFTIKASNGFKGKNKGKWLRNGIPKKDRP